MFLEIFIERGEHHQSEVLNVKLQISIIAT